MVTGCRVTGFICLFDELLIINYWALHFCLFAFLLSCLFAVLTMLALTILGNNSAIPAFDRLPTAQILQTQDDAYLIDCGEGTQMQMAKYKIRRSKISNIFISHLHGDHFYGLPGVITSMSLMGRTQDLHLYAPAPLEKILALLMEVAKTQLCYKLHFHPLTEETEIMNDFIFSASIFLGFFFSLNKNPQHSMRCCVLKQRTVILPSFIISVSSVSG